MSNKLEKHFHAFISSTRDNKYLPKEFIERTCAGKDAKWVRKYIDCILDSKEGAVYSDYGAYVEEPFEIPNKWLRIAGFDPGFNDPCAVPFAAINPIDGVVHVYSDYYEREKPVSYHAKNVMSMVRGLEMLYPIQADPSVRKRNERDGISYADYFYQISGVYLEAANNDLLYGIEKVRDYMYSGKLKFFNNLYHLKDEASLYAYPSSENAVNSDKPTDKYNHLWDAVRYMVVKLPRNPHDMESIYVQARVLNERKKEEVESQDEENVFGGFKIWMVVSQMAKENELVNQLLLEIEALKIRVARLEVSGEDSGIYLEGSPNYVRDFYIASKIKESEGVKKWLTATWY